MTLVYPIILSKDDKYFVVSIPDFNINTQGETVAEAILMARDAIGIMVLIWRMKKKACLYPLH